MPVNDAPGIDNNAYSQSDSQKFANRSDDDSDVFENESETPPSHAPQHSSEKSFDPEVEKLRLRLDHEQEIEKLRQQAYSQELEGRRLAQEDRKLAISEAQLRRETKAYQDQLMQQAKQELQKSKVLLQRTQQSIVQVLQASEEDKFTLDTIHKWEVIFEELEGDIQERAEELEEDHEEWLVWSATQLVLKVLAEHYHQIERSFLSSSDYIEWSDDQLKELQTTQQAYALNQHV